MRQRRQTPRGRGRGRRSRAADANVQRLGRTPNNLIMGRRTLREVLQHAPERIIKVIAAEGGADARGERAELMEQLQGLDVELQRVSREHLDNLCGSTSHQSFAALVRDRALISLRQFLDQHREADHSLVVMADSVYDPQNLGTIMRAAECFGADAVVWSRNRGSGLTPTVTKASVGASELLQLIEVANLVETIKRFQEYDYWVVAADAGEDAQDVDRFDFPGRVVVVMGSEGTGMRDLTRRNVDAVVRIPMPGRIASLNVSQATAIMLYSIDRRRSATRAEDLA